MLKKRTSIEKRLKKLAYQCQSAEDLCERAASVLSRPITILAWPQLPPTVTGLTLQYRNKCVICYNPTSPLLSQLSILHELAHISLGHLDDVTIHLTAVFEGKTFFSNQQEREAEKLASCLLLALIDTRSLSPPNSPIGSRFESLYE